jgi:hypothetical protein
MSGLFLAAGGKETNHPMDEERSFDIPVESILKTRKKFLERKKIQATER